MPDSPGSVPVGRGIANKLDINAGVKITAVDDAFGGKFKDSQENINFKSSIKDGKKLKVKFKVVSPQTVTLWIEHLPSKIHKDFYEDYQSKTFLPPRVALLIDKKRYASGEHVYEWDGRDQTQDRRFLLAGKYKLKITGSGVLKPKDETDITVDFPIADLIGINYRKSSGVQSTKKEIAEAEKSLEGLQDGTKYVATSLFAVTGAMLPDIWADTSVSYLAGHSNPLSFSVHNKDGGTFKKKDKSVIAIYMERSPPNASIEYDVAKGSLADMFLVMFNSCRPGNEIMIFQVLLNKCFPGPLDYKHGDKTTNGLRLYQELVGIKPADGSKNDATLAWFGINKNTTDTRSQTGIIQKKLRSYHCGKNDGKWGDKTATAIRCVQRDHPRLTETGVIDEPTRKALQHYKNYNDLGRNLAEAIMMQGADMAFGFIHKVDFKLAEDWAIKFWKSIASGKGVHKSATDATASLDVRKRKQFQFKIYTQKGINKDSKLQPARFGRFAN